MTDIKIDLVDSITQLEIQETITYAERTIAANGLTLTEGEKQESRRSGSRSSCMRKSARRPSGWTQMTRATRTPAS